jgi:arginyl-tRNA synthetase
MDYKSEIAELIKIEGVSAEEISLSLGAPPDTSKGDFCLPCFKFSKALRAAPVAIAEKIAAGITAPAFIKKIEAVAGYVNFYIAERDFAESIIAKYRQNTLSGRSNIGAGKNIVVDYSSVNIAKPFHIGHLSTTVIGGSLVNIHRHLGYNVTGINYLGDYGTQFGKLIAAYLRLGRAADVEERGVLALAEIYVQYEKLEEADPEILNEARGWSAKIERRDPDALALFNRFKKITLDEVNSVYKLLGIKFDSYLGESYFARRAGRVVKEINKLGLLEESDGARVVKLPDGMPPCLILRSDGASLYATRDIAAAEYRYDKYAFEKCLYVVAYQQNLHFKQFFKVLELMGKPWANKLAHVAFGMVSLEEGTISTREGRVVLLKDVLRSAAEKSRSLMKERGYTGKDIDKVASDVGVGAVVYSALCSARIKDILFSYEKVLNFEGETAPYLQYTHARCNSVLKKGAASGEPDFNVLTSAEGMAVLRALDGFSASVNEACEKYEPCVIAKQLTELAKAYNKFYFEHKIIVTDSPTQAAGLLLTRMTRDILKEGLALLLINAPEKM